MRQSLLLTSLSAISLLALAVLATGYFAEFGPLVQYNVFSGPHPRQVSVDLQLQAGRVAFYWQNSNIAPTKGAIKKLNVRWRGLRFRSPDLRRSFWEFDGHLLMSTKSAQLYIFAFPIWFLVVPCLIAPLLWLRKRKGGPMGGFPIILTTPASSEDSLAARQ
jgi:hypothetical protein